MLNIKDTVFSAGRHEPQKINLYTMRYIGSIKYPHIWGSLLAGSGISCLSIPTEPFQLFSRWTVGLVSWSDCGWAVTQTTHYLAPSLRLFEFVTSTNMHSNFQCYKTLCLLRFRYFFSVLIWTIIRLL